MDRNKGHTQPTTRHKSSLGLRADECGCILAVSRLCGTFEYCPWLLFWVKSANTWIVATYRNVPAEKSIAMPVAL